MDSIKGLVFPVLFVLGKLKINLQNCKKLIDKLANSDIIVSVKEI